MNDDKKTHPATPLSASALVLQDGTIVSLAAGSHERTAYGALAVQFISTTWRLALSGLVAGVVLGLVAYAVMPKSYTATTVIESGPVAQSLDQNSKFASLLGGGARGLLGGTSVLPQMTKDFLQLMQSNVVGVELLKDPVICKQMFPNEWDAKTKTWHQPSGVLAAMRRTIKGLLGATTLWLPPDSERVRDYLGTHLTIAPLGDGTLQQLSVESEDAKWSAYLLDRTVKAADQYLRARDSKRAQASIKYWQEQLDRVVGGEDVRTALIANILDSQRRMVFAGVDLPFAIDVVDPVSVPSRPSGPSLLRTLAISIALCLFVSFVPRMYRRLRASWQRVLGRREGYTVYTPSREDTARHARYAVPMSTLTHIWERLFHNRP